MKNMPQRENGRSKQTSLETLLGIRNNCNLSGCGGYSDQDTDVFERYYILLFSGAGSILKRRTRNRRLTTVMILKFLVHVVGYVIFLKHNIDIFPKLSSFWFLIKPYQGNLQHYCTKHLNQKCYCSQCWHPICLCVSPSCCTSDPAPCLWPGRAAGDGPCIWAPVTHMENQDGVRAPASA